MERGSCRKYKIGIATVTVSLPEWGQGCRHCRLFFRKKYETGVYYCELTGEDLNPRTLDTYIDDVCPIEWADEEDGNG